MTRAGQTARYPSRSVCNHDSSNSRKLLPTYLFWCILHGSARGWKNSTLSKQEGESGCIERESWTRFSTQRQVHASTFLISLGMCVCRMRLNVCNKNYIVRALWSSAADASCLCSMRFRLRQREMRSGPSSWPKLNKCKPRDCAE